MVIPTHNGSRLTFSKHLESSDSRNSFIGSSRLATAFETPKQDSSSINFAFLVVFLLLSIGLFVFRFKVAVETEVSTFCNTITYIFTLNTLRIKFNLISNHKTIIRRSFIFPRIGLAIFYLVEINSII